MIRGIVLLGGRFRCTSANLRKVIQCLCRCREVQVRLPNTTPTQAGGGFRVMLVRVGERTNPLLKRIPRLLVFPIVV